MCPILTAHPTPSPIFVHFLIHVLQVVFEFTVEAKFQGYQTYNVGITMIICTHVLDMFTEYSTFNFLLISSVTELLVEVFVWIVWICLDF